MQIKKLDFFHVCTYLDSCCLAAVVVVVVFDNCCCHCCLHHWRPHRSPSTSTCRPPTPGRWTWPSSRRRPTPWCRWTLSYCKHKGDNLGSQVRVRLPTVTHQRRQNLIYLVKSPKSRLRPWKRRKHDEDTRNILILIFDSFGLLDKESQMRNGKIWWFKFCDEWCKTFSWQITVNITTR